MINGIKNMMFDEVIPPKIPRTLETLGKTIDRKQVKAQNDPQMITLAVLVSSNVPKMREYRLNLNGIIIVSILTISTTITANTDTI
jgi:hypothetical protein